MSKARRAIIMAAGLGERLQPVTLDIPKPLVTVNGKRMIDTIVDALHKNGIFEIYVVVGHKKELFYEWAKENQNIALIENPLYAQCNNISSLYMARFFLEDAFILDGDQIIYNKDVLNPEFKNSGYNAVWTDSPTNEWVMEVSDRKVISCKRTGGNKGWQLFSISRWNHKDAKKLKTFLEEEFETKKNYQIYWDDIPIFQHFAAFDLEIYPMNKNDVIEIDSFPELLAIDESYKNYGE